MKSSSSSSSEETEGIGRFYECVFCKRGFTTAQALGGHMNIHRKDRLKNHSNKPTKQVHDHEENCQQILNYPRPFSSNFIGGAEAQVISYRTFLPDSPSSSSSSSYSKDWRVSLNLQEKKQVLFGVQQDDHQLDLELRLGVNP